MTTPLTEIDDLHAQKASLNTACQLITASLTAVSQNLQTTVSLPVTRFIFILYYQSPNPNNDKNESFKKAALYLQERYKQKEPDCVCLINVFVLVSEFVALWQKISELSSVSCYALYRLHIVAHGTTWDPRRPNSEPGISAASSKTPPVAGTINVSGLKRLAKLNFVSSGNIIIHACNSGRTATEFETRVQRLIPNGPEFDIVNPHIPQKVAVRTIHPVSYHLSLHQAVPVIGQSCWTSFSSTRSHYTEIKEEGSKGGADKNIYLWGYYKPGEDNRTIMSAGKIMTNFRNADIWPCKTFSNGVETESGNDEDYM